MRHSGRLIKGDVLAHRKKHHIAEVVHKGIRFPADEPLDIKGGKPHSMEEDTSSNTEGVGTPFRQSFSIGFGIKMVGLGGQPTHIRFDCGGSKEPGHISVGIPIEAEGCRGNIDTGILLGN